jgi:D-aminopeptidase
MTRQRLRDLGLTIGRLPTGPFNAITDVSGVIVGHSTVIHDTPRIARTGITLSAPREGNIWRDHTFAGFHALNGAGEMTGVHWLTESGLLTTPIGITNTSQVGIVHDRLVAYGQENGLTTESSLPVIAETWDGWLNDADAFHITAGHVDEALAKAAAGPVAEGNVGGGTGMICHDFKGGIGTSSRRIATTGGRYTVGALVQANHGDRHMLRVDGVPVGLEIGSDAVPIPWDESPTGGSIIGIVATDAPILPIQCRQLAQRAVIGLARSGGLGHDGSGDMFLAFSTGNHIPANLGAPLDLQMLPPQQLNPLFEAAAEAIEEAILNALTAAETMIGFEGHVVDALPLDDLQQIMARYRPFGRPGNSS